MKFTEIKLKHLTYVVGLTVGATLLIWNSCKDDIVDARTSNVVFPDSQVSYSKHVEVLFQQACAYSGCHAGSVAGGKLDLSINSYSNLMNHFPVLVVPSQSNNSLLIQRLDGRIGNRMPNPRDTLNLNQIRGLMRWIDEGAANN